MTIRTPSSSSTRVSLRTHVGRAFGWSLGRITLAPDELAALVAAGVTDPAVQHYAAWRRSLLLVAIGPTVAVFLLAMLDAAAGGMRELSFVGVGLEAGWLLATAGLAVACARGIRAWTRPGTSSRLLRTGWAAVFVIPIVYALLPAGLLLRVHAHASETTGGVAADGFEALLEATFEFALSGGTFLLLLPAVLSIIPGAVNGCLRVKSVLPAAQLPGWLLVFVAPLILLFWLVILVVANQALQSPLLVLGFVLWAGSPIWYAFRARVFVQPQVTAQGAAQIARAKRIVTLISLAGVALVVVSTITSKVAGLTMLGMDPEAAVSRKLEELGKKADFVRLDEVHDALAHSKSFGYVFDLSSWQLVVDILAKLLVATAVFADLVLRATLVAWRNDRSLRARPEATAYDASASAAVAALATTAPRPA